MGQVSPLIIDHQKGADGRSAPLLLLLFLGTCAILVWANRRGQKGGGETDDEQSAQEVENPEKRDFYGLSYVEFYSFQNSK